MKRRDKYDVSGLSETQFEPGSRKRVLKNLMGIKNKLDMDKIEAVALKQTEDLLFNTYDREDKFSAVDLCKIHKIWLGNIYEWAGKYRNIDLAKGNFRFAHAKYLPELMREFEQEFLFKNTPCYKMSAEELIEALAKVHAEFILIHPFCEGNGRLGRLLSTIMAVQAALPPLTFKIIEGAKRKQYIAAVQASLNKNYEPMKEIFRLIVK
ncbi:MAG: Fic family protein [Candidatus Omnitrophota bacterium]